MHLRQDVMIARNTVRREPERREQAAEPLIGCRGSIFREIAGRDEQMRSPGIALHHGQQTREGGARVDPLELSAWFGEDVGIGDVHDAKGFWGHSTSLMV